jgi:hypothetical protein
LLAVLLSGGIQVAAVVAAELEVDYLELATHAQLTEVTVRQGETLSIDLDLGASGNLDESYTHSAPARANVDTVFSISSNGAKAYGSPVSKSFWALGSTQQPKRVRWEGYPSPYRVSGSIVVDRLAPVGTYTFSAHATFGSQPTAPRLDNNVADTIVVNIIAGDQTPPTTTVGLTGSSGASEWFLDDVTVTLTGVDDDGTPAATSYSVDGGTTWLPYSNPFVVATTGVSSVQYYSTDAAGNSDAIQAQEIKIDRAVPEVTTGIATGSRAREFTVDWSGSDPTPGAGIAEESATLNGIACGKGDLVDAEGTYELVATATDKAGRSTTVSTSFVVDRSAPAVSILSPIHGRAYKSDVTFDYLVSDSDEALAIEDDPDKGYVWTPEGEYTASVRATDRAGNFASASAEFILDTTKPTVTATYIATPGENGWWRSDAQVTLNAEDPTSGNVSSGVQHSYWRVDRSEWTTFTAPFSVGEGEHELEFFAVDNAGNASDIVFEAVNVDSIAPLATLDVAGTLSNGWYVGSSPFGSVGGTDSGSGFALAQFALDDPDAWTDYSGPVSVPEGAHTLFGRVVDVAGNVSDVISHDVNVDMTKPSTSCNVDGTAGLNEWLTSAAVIELLPEDVGSGVASTEYSLDNGSSWIGYDGPFAYAVEGETNILYRSTDVAGNVEDPKTCTVKIDTKAPTLDISGAHEGEWLKQALIDFVAGDESPGSGVAFSEVLLDGEAISGETLVLDNRLHSVEGTVRDAAGNETSVAFSFWVDSMAPDITITSPADGGVYSTSQPFEFSVTDALDLSPFVSSDPIVPFTFAAEGRQSASVAAEDHAGNVSTKSVSFLIDTTAPVSNYSLDGIAGRDGWWKQSSVNVTLFGEDETTANEASGLDEIYYSIDNGAIDEYDTPFAIGDGEHTISYWAQDKAGNVEGTHTFSLKVDTIAPVIAITSPTNGASYGYGASLTIDWDVAESGSGLRSQQGSLNAVPVLDGQTLQLLAPGSRQMIVDAEDTAGNTVRATSDFNVRFAFGGWLTPTSLEKTWNAGRTLPVKFLVNDFAGRPTNACTALLVATLNGVEFDRGIAYVQYDSAGRPFYQYNLKTLKNQVGTLRLSLDLKDGSACVVRDISLR